MKSFQVIILYFFIVINNSYGKSSLPNNNPIVRTKPKVEDPIDNAVEVKPIIMLPKSKLKFIVSEKTTQQPLESLYKYYVGKKPVMRKFIPTKKVLTEQSVITHRPIMKQRKFVIAPTSPKPPPSKEDLFSNNSRKLLNPIFLKKNSTTYKGSQSNGDNYENYASSDMMVAGSRKVYRKIMGELPNKFKIKPNTVAVKENTLKNTIPKLASNDSVKIQDETTIKTPKILETNYSSSTPNDLVENVTKGNLLDEANEKADKSEFIFLQPSTEIAPKDEAKEKDRAIEQDIQNGEEDLATESEQIEV